MLFAFNLKCIQSDYVLLLPENEFNTEIRLFGIKHILSS